MPGAAGNMVLSKWPVFLFLTSMFVTVSGGKPNIVFILTDDQDVELGGMTPIARTRKLIGDQGVTFSNMFVTSPLCCPSRSAILTGKYNHNNGAVNNSISGNCSSPAWQATSEKETFATQLKGAGYRTFFAGKYLNEYGFPAAGGLSHVPPGWDSWNGLQGNSRYYNYSLSVNGREEAHGDKYEDDYLTDVIKRKALQFLQDEAAVVGNGDGFFMMLSTPACHAPFTPAPQYQKLFANVSAPRTGSFNQYDANRHWLVRSVKHPMGPESMKLIDPVFRNRWRTLQSVDDLVEEVVTELDKQGVLDNTYVVYASDNGYHLGQLSLPYDKRQLYEFDIRVPLMVRGPGIKAGQTRQEMALNIDLAPTFLDLAGLKLPADMDGQSLKPLLLLNATGVGGAPVWRSDFLVEHSGEVQEEMPGCPSLNHQGVAQCYPDCVCEDSFNNTYSCVRTMSEKYNMMYCVFADSESFVEVYDLTADKYQLKNVAKTVDPAILADMDKRLVQLSVCSGDACRDSRLHHG